LLALAQQSSGKVWRIAHVYPGKPDNPPDHALYDVFRGALRELGYIEGKNLVIDQRSAEGKLERLPSSPLPAQDQSKGSPGDASNARM
jgi:putative ABC transport system substrate-binding protein